MYRKSSETYRMQRFFVAIDILRNEKNYKVNFENDKEFEVLWLDKNWKEVRIHIREEISSHKNKVLYFVSCF